MSFKTPVTTKTELDVESIKQYTITLIKKVTENGGDFFRSQRQIYKENKDLAKMVASPLYTAIADANAGGLPPGRLMRDTIDLQDWFLGGYHPGLELIKKAIRAGEARLIDHVEKNNSICTEFSYN